MAVDPPILEFDPDREGLLEPSKIHSPDLPTHAVFCFFWEEVEALTKRDDAQQMDPFQSECPDMPVVRILHDDVPVAVISAGVGAPLAGTQLEEAIARGCTKIIACGGAGVLDSDIACGDFVVPTEAIRDEGMSYHYLPPGEPALPSTRARASIVAALEARNCPFVSGKTWTTDAPFRETRGKIKRRREQGCVTVEMEAAAFFAIASFRGVQLAQLLYGGDDVGGDEWDSRQWSTSRARGRMLQLAIEACVRL